MKQTLTLLCIVCPFILFAQTANHFENESSRWFVADTYPNGNQQNPSFVETMTTVYGFQGDTTIQSEQWFKMYSSSDTSFTTNLEYQGLLRAENGYVFFQDTTSTVDTLYNFNLEEGDSVLYVFYDTYPEYLEVVDVDSVEINSQMFKRLRFREPTVIQAFTELDEVWIEGIGSLLGPLFTIREEVFSDGEMPDSLKLVCSHMDEILYWENPFYDNCMVNIILDIENAEMVGFDIYPNPSSRQIFIRQQQSNAGQFYVRDILGREVRSGLLQSDNQSVDISELKRGVYFVTVLFDNTTLTKEILKY
tara:strand:+ start:43 stop:960 length:918 start_codon:yes stop_codon:yes gene_type:complete